MKRKIAFLLTVCMMNTLLVHPGNAVKAQETEAADSSYTLTVTGPSGTVYPYQDRVKTYLTAEDPNIMDHFVEGTLEGGDTSIAPVSITWSDTENSAVTKYVVEYGTKEDYSDAVCVVKDTELSSKSIDVYNLYKGSVYYVRVTAYAGEAALRQATTTFQTTDLGPRIMKIDGIHNVRDIGGYKTADGKTTVQGLVYRGGEMDGSGGAALTAEGAAYMRDVMGIKTDMDLRGNEVSSPIPSAKKKAFAISAYESAFTQTALYRKIFSTLANDHNYPVYIHCAGGADRTGTVCYLLNALVGVSEEDLVRDYEMTSYSVYGLRAKDLSSYQYPEFVARLKTYEGDTLAEKTESYMLSIGVTEAEIANIRAIMLGEAQQAVVQPQDVFKLYEDLALSVEVSGNKAVASVTIDGTKVPFTATENGFTVAVGDMPETLSAGTVCGTVTFEDEQTAPFQFECDDTNLVQELSDINTAHKTVYDYSRFSLGTATVDDAEAVNGKAYTMEGANLAGPYKINIYRYDPGSADYSSIHIGSVPATEVWMNRGYMLYKFTVDIPAEGLTDGSYVYFLDNWLLRLVDLSKDMKNMAGKTVDMYMSMKVEGDSFENCTVYMDQFVMVDHCEDNVGSDCCCTKCGSFLEGVEPEPTEPDEVEPDEDRGALPEELENVSSSHIIVYDYSKFSRGTAVVEDEEAVDGQAYTVEGADLTGSQKITIYRYDAGSADYSSIHIGSVAAVDVKLNQGYQYYKFTVDIPAEGLTDGNYVYFLDNWHLRLVDLSKDMHTLAGKTVDMYLSMKVTGDSATSCTVYVDQFIMVDHCEDYQVGSSCTKCGKDFSQNIDPSAHTLYDYDYSQIKGDTVVQDADAYQGMAKQYTADLSANAIPLYRYDPGSEDNAIKYMLLGTVANADLKVDQGYQTYSFTTALPKQGMTDNAAQRVYFTDNWSITNYQMATDLRALAGKTVTVTMSMKITGTLSSATVYVDRMQILDSCQDHLSADGSYCTACGKSMVDLSLPAELWQVDNQHITRYDTDHFALDGGGAIVADPASAVGQAFTINKSVATGMVVYRYAASGTDFAHQYLQLIKIAAADIQTNDGYHFYKSTVDVPADIVSPGTYVYVGDSWYCQNRTLCNDLVKYAGKTVDFYLSMKVIGTDAANAEIYIDQMLLVDPCDNHWDEGVVTQEPTTEAEGVKTYTCTVCGETKTEAIAKLPAPAASWNLELDGSIGMNFVLNVTAEQAAAATVEYTVGGVSTTKNVSELLNEAGEAIVSVELAAAQMIEDVTVTVNADGTQMTKTYSVREYAAYILNGEYSDETKNLVKAMLNYGAASQTYFGYQADAPVNAGWEIEAATVPTEGGSMDVTGQVSGVNLYGASLVHRNKVGVRFYFTADSLEGISFGDCEAVEKNGMYYVEFADIGPQDLDEDLTVSVTNGTDIQTVTYAPMDYIIRMYAKGGSCAALVQALYGYYLAAEAYTAA